ncbi:MAG: biotin--[acetyl-CoA-carboxylase] ligase [Bacteroidales bacterium]|nr:biotin--[acetyl-CoA-carboxylase] ligase [Bacteroidales bacterium]
MIGKKLIELARVDSTNAYASLLYSDSDFEDGTVIWAHDQFAGKGQHDHQWISESGKNLTFTVCLKPRFLAPGSQFQLNKAFTLAIIDFIRSFPNQASPAPHPEAFIKWPNDIYVGNQKIGGILIENKIMGSTFETSIAGIGLNINQTRFAPDIPNPVSLIHMLRHEIVLKDALHSLCDFLNRRYLELQQAGNENLDQEFNENLLGFDKWRLFVQKSNKIEGRIRGVDKSGLLLLEDRNGEISAYNHGEVEYQINENNAGNAGNADNADNAVNR